MNVNATSKIVRFNYARENNRAAREETECSRFASMHSKRCEEHANVKKDQIAIRAAKQRRELEI
jgi:hypothetical protein